MRRWKAYFGIEMFQSFSQMLVETPSCLGQNNAQTRVREQIYCSKIFRQHHEGWQVRSLREVQSVAIRMPIRAAENGLARNSLAPPSRAFSTCSRFKRTMGSKVHHMVCVLLESGGEWIRPFRFGRVGSLSLHGVAPAGPSTVVARPAHGSRTSGRRKSESSGRAAAIPRLQGTAQAPPGAALPRGISRHKAKGPGALTVGSGVATPSHATTSSS